MTGIDTNVLVRYVTHDDPRQWKAAATLLENECTSDRPGMVNDIVLCELVWVLEDVYGFEGSQIVGVLEQIVRTAQLRVENPTLVWRAIASFRRGFDFADALILETNRHSGCVDTVTLDRRASRIPGMRLLSSS